MLSDRDRAVLNIESRNWRYAATKERHVRETLGLSPVRYYQVVASLIDNPEAVALAPQTISRLRAVRARSRSRRAA